MALLTMADGMERGAPTACGAGGGARRLSGRGRTAARGLVGSGQGIHLTLARIRAKPRPCLSPYSSPNPDPDPSQVEERSAALHRTLVARGVPDDGMVGSPHRLQALATSGVDRVGGADAGGSDGSGGGVGVGGGCGSGGGGRRTVRSGLQQAFAAALEAPEPQPQPQVVL